MESSSKALSKSSLSSFSPEVFSLPFPFFFEPRFCPGGAGEIGERGGFEEGASSEAGGFFFFLFCEGELVISGA